MLFRWIPASWEFRVAADPQASICEYDDSRPFIHNLE